MSTENTPMWKLVAKKVIPHKQRETMKRIAVLAIHQWGSLTTKKTNRTFGVNLIGHIRGDFGLGESCRLVAQALKETPIPFSICNVPLNGPAKEENMSWCDYEREDIPYGINLVHLNPNEVIGAVKKRSMNGHYNIGYWLWELPEFPTEWNYAFRLVDEIWTPANFVTQALQKRTKKRVYTMPYGFPKPPLEEDCGREHFGLPQDKFLFLVSYDGNSVSERKNPFGAVRAFCNAFSECETDVGLVIKATHAREEDLQKIKEMLGGRNVYILTKSYRKAEFNSLIQCTNAYVSLHRAEGFGLVMAEAMLLKTPVIATAWSANMEFMNDQIACLVPAQIVELQEDHPPYHKGDHWASPDEAVAAEWMRKLRVDQGFGLQLAERAQRYIEETLTPKAAGEKMHARIRELEMTIGET